MSNDITSSAARVAPQPVAVAPLQNARAADVQARPAAPVPEPVASQPDPRETRRTLEESTQRLNQQMKRNNRELTFSVDDLANKVVVTVKNRETGEIVRQIPSEVALRVAHNLDDMKGLLQDAKS